MERSRVARVGSVHAPEVGGGRASVRVTRVGTSHLDACCRIRRGPFVES
jgi:hypothetical protein